MGQRQLMVDLSSGKSPSAPLQVRRVSRADRVLFASVKPSDLGAEPALVKQDTWRFARSPSEGWQHLSTARGISEAAASQEIFVPILRKKRAPS